MMLSIRSPVKPCLWAWISLACLGIILSPGFAPGARAQADLDQKLAAGEIVVSRQDIPGKSVKCAQMLGVVNAPPDIVWQVITDVNNFKFFLPHMLNSMLVPPERVPLLVAGKPSRAEEVEQLLGPVPADPAASRIPGGKYTVYQYGNLDLPWPVHNRWYIIKVSRDETGAPRHYYQTSWSLVLGNLKENSGAWILEPFGSSSTKATYRLCTDPGGVIPGFIAKRFTYSTLPHILEAVRKRTATLRWENRP